MCSEVTGIKEAFLIVGNQKGVSIISRMINQVRGYLKRAYLQGFQVPQVDCVREGNPSRDEVSGSLKNAAGGSADVNQVDQAAGILPGRNDPGGGEKSPLPEGFRPLP